MGIERPEDIDRIISEFEATGLLDSEGLEDGVVTLHEALALCGCDPERPESYRAVIAAVKVITSAHPILWPLVLNEMCRWSLRSIRDLKRRGGGEPV